MRKKIFSAVIMMICALVFFYLQYQVVSKKSAYTPATADYIVILGHSLENGETPSDWLVGRLEEGLALYEQGYSEKIIVTGGQPSSHKKSVAQVMSDWLVARGVDASHISLDEAARNTYENFKFAKLITGEDKSIIVVSNDFHMYRSMLIADDYFEDVSGQASAVPLSFKKILAYLKEPLSIIKYIAVHRHFR